MIFDRLRLSILGCILFALGTVTVSGAGPPGRISERFQFEIPKLAVAHQGGNELTLRVSYDYARGLKARDYPDFRQLALACEEFFRSYPNQTDFWEILNLKLTGNLLANFPAVASITVEIQVAPSARIPYPRASVVTRMRR